MADFVDPAPIAEPLPFEFSGRTAKNRLLKAAMSEQLASWDPTDLDARGIPSKELIQLYRRWSEGGYGMIMTGNTMLSPIQLEAPGNLIVPPDSQFSGERFEGFKQLAAEGKRHGSLMILQLQHLGRQVPEIVNSNPISASDVQLEGKLFGITFAKSRPMEQRDFDEVIESFAHASEFAYKSGFDGIEIQGGQFHSAIRARVPPSFIIGVKLNSVEFQQGGITTEECATLCEELEARGFDFVELTGGTYQELAFAHRRETTRRREAFFLDFAEKIAPQLSRTRVYVTGGFLSVRGMVEALKTVDGVGIGRPVAHEPDLGKNMLQGLTQRAKNVLLDQQDFVVTNKAATAQMALIGRDRELFDMSTDAGVQAYIASKTS